MSIGATTNTSTASTTDFATISRILTDAAAHFNGTAPSFRSPPRIPGATRSITRNRDRSVTVAVAVRDRPLLAVVADMIDGVMLTSDGAGDDDLYDALWISAQNWIEGRRPHPGSSRHLRVAA